VKGGRLVRVLLVCAAVTLLGGQLAAGAASRPEAAAVDPTNGAGDAIQRFGSCLAAGSTGDLLLVLDTSASLQTTDPDADRVTAAKYMVEKLADYVARGEDLHLRVAVAGFASSFAPKLDWTQLDSTSVGSIESAIESFESQDTGFETDYWNAVTGARRYLADEAGDHADCQAWVWFSDGMFDLDKRDTDGERASYGLTKPYDPTVELESDAAADKVQAAGQKDLCRPGGVADALRFQGVTTLAVGLGDSDTFGLMEGVANGSGSCGTRSAAHLGDFLLAQEVDSLLFAFDKFADPANPPVQTQKPVCNGAVCSQGAHVFFLDDTISKVRILGGASIDGYDAILVDPAGGRTTLKPGQDVPRGTGVELSGTWESPRTFDLEIAKTGEVWSGKWQLVFVADGAPAGALGSTNIRLFGDVQPAWVNPQESLSVGESHQLEFRLENAAGTPIPEVLGSASLEAELRPQGGEVVELPTLDEGNLASPQSVDLTGVSSGPAVLVLTLSVTTKGDPGTTLQPEVREYRLKLAPPASYPTLPTSVDFGAGDDTKPVTVTLPLGGEPGCVWLTGSEVASLPQGVSKASVTSTSSEADPATGSVPVTISVDAVGNGLVGGSLTFATTPKGCSGQQVPVTVKYRYELRRPRDTTVFLGLLIAIVVAGVLLPVGMLYLMKWRTATVPGSSLAVASARGPVSSADSFLASVTLGHQDTRVLPLEGADRRSIVVTPWVTLRTKVGLGLTEPGFATVDPGPAVTSSGGRKLPLAVQDRWVAALDPSNPHHGDVEFVFVLSPTASKLPELLADARNRGPELVGRLRESLGSPPSAPPGGDEVDAWGATPGGPLPPQPTGSPPGAPGGYDQW